jgi:hypothetical protein
VITLSNCTCGKGKTSTGLGFLVCVDPQCPEQDKINRSREEYQRKTAEQERMLIQQGLHPSQLRESQRSARTVSLSRLNAHHADLAEMAIIQGIR